MEYYPTRTNATERNVTQCMQVLAHLGSKVSHAMELVVEAANERFERLSSVKQSELLHVVMEVGEGRGGEDRVGKGGARMIAVAAKMAS